MNERNERQELADVLAHERNVLRTMIDLIPAFIYAKDAQSRFTACNALVAGRLGTIPAELIGKTDFDFFPREMAERFFADEQRLIELGTPLIDHEEIAFDKVRGEPRVILTSKVPLRDANGKVSGIVGTGYDITERKQAEQRLATIERHESIGRLAAGVAHEINTPIQFLSDSVAFIDEGVRELLTYLGKPTAPSDQESTVDDEIEYLREELPPALARVAEGLKRIAEIVRSMKEFAQADQRGLAAVDINRAIASTLVVARSAYQQVADVQTDFGAVPEITCHGGQINQVFLNLLMNAAEAIRAVVGNSGIRGVITIRTSADADYVTIYIADTGSGISDAIKARVFDPFFTTKDVGMGIGQGLTVARNIVVNSHRGALEFETAVGKGTTFIVKLPIHHAG